MAQVLSLLKGAQGSDVHLQLRQPRSLSLRSPNPRRRTSLETGLLDMIFRLGYHVHIFPGNVLHTRALTHTLMRVSC